MANKYGLRTEIILHMTLLLGAALLFGGFLILKLTERELVDQRVTSLSSAAEVVGSALGDMLGAEPELDLLQPRIARLLQPLSSGMTTTGVWKWSANTLTPVHLYGPEKSALDSRQQLTSVRYLPEPQFVLSYSNAWLSPGRASSSYYKVTMPLYSKGGYIGVLQMRFPLDGVGHRVRTSFKILVVYVFLYGTVLFLFGLYQLNRNVLRPIRSLMGSTRQVADGNLDEKVSEAGPVEISSLATSFNLMVDALRNSRQRTDQHIRSLQQANQELEETRGELLRSEKMASIGHLAAGMAHEIGNPLAAVVGYLGLLKSELPEGPHRDIVGHADTELERIDQLVRDVLDYAKPVTDKEEDLDPVQIARQAMTMLDRQGVFDSVTLVDDLPAQLPYVRMVPHRLMQVCVNLFVNARDASPSMAKIRVSGGANDTSVWLAIADEGQGIAETNLRYIFDPFYTTKAPGKGRGLGLAVCHRVVDEVGGAIEVQSEVEVGSVFKVVLKRELNDDAG
ncbi:MAG: sensor histidine kinase [Pedobacter sp.]